MTKCKNEILVFKVFLKYAFFNLQIILQASRSDLFYEKASMIFEHIILSFFRKEKSCRMLKLAFVDIIYVHVTRWLSPLI